MLFARLAIPGAFRWQSSHERNPESSDAGQKSFEHLLGILPACSRRSEELNQAARADLADQIASGQPMKLETGLHLRQTRQMMLDTYSAEKAAALFALLKRNGTWQCPTLVLNRAIAFADDSSFTNDPRLKYMPLRLRASWDPANVFDLTPQDFAYEKKEFEKELKSKKSNEWGQFLEFSCAH